MTVMDQTQDSDDIGKRLKENLCPRCETTLTWVSKTDVTAKRKCKFMTASTKKVNHGV